MSHMDYWKTVLDRDIDKIIKCEDAPDYRIKRDEGKPRLDLVPMEIVKAIGIVLTKALEDHTEGSWRSVEIFRFRAAMMRHLVEYMIDPKSVASDSKLPHLWHLAANVSFLIELENLKEDKQ